MHPVLQTLQQRFPTVVLAVGEDLQRHDLSAQVTRDGWEEVAHFLHDDSFMAFDHMTDICSADFPDELERFEVIYHFCPCLMGQGFGSKFECPKTSR